VGLDEFFGDRQADAGAADIAGTVGTKEALEEKGEIVVRYDRAAVAETDLNLLRQVSTRSGRVSTSRRTTVLTIAAINIGYRSPVPHE
jgi:hypothetical protein